MMKNIIGLALVLLFTSSCQGQSETTTERAVGGPCQDCEALLDYNLLQISPSAMDTLPGFFENSPKVKITGTVYQHDGKTPANNVILYVYHTNRNGLYEPSKNPMGWEKRHGQFRGWMKTGADGKFTFYTFRPAHYPNVAEPEHIHLYVKEPDTIPYYMDSYVFSDDPLLTEKEKKELNNRGGSGVITLEHKEGLWTVDRSIVLGLNIPNY